MLEQTDVGCLSENDGYPKWLMGTHHDLFKSKGGAVIGRKHMSIECQTSNQTNKPKKYYLSSLHLDNSV